MNITAALKEGSSALDAAGIPDPRRESASLLAFALEKENAFLFAHPEYDLSEREVDRFRSVVSRRSEREPFQYITGRQEFYGLEFDVRPGVLIPRPETEILVEAAIRAMAELARPKFYEIGVGSGCISISILKNLPAANAEAVDISDACLELAATNAAKHNVSGRIKLRKADLFEGAAGPYDAVISNPPYIPEADRPDLQAEVLSYEPHEALFSGSSGLVAIARIIDGAPGHLSVGGLLLIEIGAGQAAEVLGMLTGGSWSEVAFLKDLQGIDRVLSARYTQ
jgi:release factor glutamine methyltransferase